MISEELPLAAPQPQLEPKALASRVHMRTHERPSLRHFGVRTQLAPLALKAGPDEPTPAAGIVVARVLSQNRLVVVDNQSPLVGMG